MQELSGKQKVMAEAVSVANKTEIAPPLQAEGEAKKVKNCMFLLKERNLSNDIYILVSKENKIKLSRNVNNTKGTSLTLNTRVQDSEGHSQADLKFKIMSTFW